PPRSQRCRQDHVAPGGFWAATGLAGRDILWRAAALRAAFGPRRGCGRHGGDPGPAPRVFAFYGAWKSSPGRAGLGRGRERTTHRCGVRGLSRAARTHRPACRLHEWWRAANGEPRNGAAAKTLVVAARRTLARTLPGHRRTDDGARART